MSTVISVENLSKAYQIGQIGTGTISRDLERWWSTKIRGKEDPFLKIGEINDRSTKGESDMVWSLRDISFKIKKGDAVGIIGRNGAGKSTLLKVLSEITSPTSGRISIKGRVASLLEVGTGFHPELTGRENIFLNGAIMGMRKREIQNKLEEIIDFSGVERYIDTPVKRYSSGMYVRLAFAVAAHLEPEILIVDEVLAVGDADFQKKCLGKMKDVSVNEGRTVLFVSHNMGAINTLCNHAILLKNGGLEYEGSTQSTIDRYLNGSESENAAHYINEKPGTVSDVLEIKVVDDRENTCNNFAYDQPVKILFKIKVAAKHMDAIFGFRIKDQMERNIFTSEIAVSDFMKTEGILDLSVIIPPKVLVPNKYQVIVGYHKLNVEIIKYLEGPVHFAIEETGSEFFQYANIDYGCVFVDCEWK